MGAACCGGEEKAKPVGAATVDEDGNVQLSADHQEYLNKSAEKTKAKSAAIKAQYEKSQKASPGKAAVARYWFEFSNMVSQQLEEYRNNENERLKNTEAEAKDPKVAHEKFVKDMNNDLEAYKLKIYQAFAKEDERGNLHFQKEQTLEFYDELVRGSEAMVIPCAEMFSRYTLKYNASQDADVQKKRADFCDSGVKARVELAKGELKKAKAEALTNAMKYAKADKAASLNALEQAINYAKMAEADAAAAEAKLTELKAERDKKAAEADLAAAAKADKEAAKEKTEDQKAKEKTKEEAEETRKKDLAEAKEKAQAALAQAITDAKEDTDAMQKAIEEADKAGGKQCYADTTEAYNTMNELIEKKAQADALAQAGKDALATAASNWRITVDKEIDAAIHQWTEEYEANSCTKQQAGFAKFFDGKNETGNDFELTKADLYKNLAVGEGFEPFVQELGWMVTEAGALEAVKSRLDKAIEELEKAKAEAFEKMGADKEA